eukprot:1942493-Alexandrium_andersonii.AAC.1
MPAERPGRHWALHPGPWPTGLARPRAPDAGDPAVHWLCQFSKRSSMVVEHVECLAGQAWRLAS